VERQVDGHRREAAASEGVADDQHEAALGHDAVGEDDDRQLLAGRRQPARDGRGEGDGGHRVAAVAAQAAGQRIEEDRRRHGAVHDLADRGEGADAERELGEGLERRLPALHDRRDRDLERGDLVDVAVHGRRRAHGRVGPGGEGAARAVAEGGAEGEHVGAHGLDLDGVVIVDRPDLAHAALGDRGVALQQVAERHQRDRRAIGGADAIAHDHAEASLLGQRGDRGRDLDADAVAEDRDGGRDADRRGAAELPELDGVVGDGGWIDRAGELEHEVRRQGEAVVGAQPLLGLHDGGAVPGGERQVDGAGGGVAQEVDG
jgi:hypothetical protein